jgi:transcriptional regulator with XRE-family HTH domain
LLELGVRARAFRGRYGLTQDEVALAIGAAGGAAVGQWERGETVPDGVRRLHLMSLLDGRRWRELRGALVAGHGLPPHWRDATRWYRRASRERPPRETLGPVLRVLLDELRALESTEALRRHYVHTEGDWARGVVAARGLVRELAGGLRRIEDAAYGLRWLEIGHGRRYDVARSLVRQLPANLLD